MQLELKRVFQEEGFKLPLEAELDFSNEEIYGAFPIIKPVVISGSVENQASVVVLRYSAEVEYTRECDRCLDLSTTNYVLEYEHILTAEIEDDDSEELIYIPDFKLEFEELAKEDIILDMPTKHLCKQECKGLCPKCGCNLNHSQCSCEMSEPDPRLAALRQLLEADAQDDTSADE